MQNLLAALVMRVNAHIHATWAQACAEVAVGPFRAFFHPTDPTLSHASPADDLDDAGALPAAIAALRQAFAARGARLRVELSVLTHAHVPAALQLAGLVAEEETPLLVATPASFQRPRADAELKVRLAGERDERGAPGAAPAASGSVREPTIDLAFVAALVRQGFELRGTLAEADVAALAASVAAGVRVAVAELGGAPAGSGLSTPRGATTEISTVSTLPPLRRRGVAAGVVATLVEQHFAAGGELAWACAPDGAAYALLSRLGFLDAAVRASYREP